MPDEGDDLKFLEDDPKLKNLIWNTNKERKWVLNVPILNTIDIKVKVKTIDLLPNNKARFPTIATLSTSLRLLSLVVKFRSGNGGTMYDGGTVGFATTTLSSKLMDLDSGHTRRWPYSEVVLWIIKMEITKKADLDIVP